MEDETTASGRPGFGAAIRAAYRNGGEDETLPPLVLRGADGRPAGRIGAGDSLVFYDLRGEREIEISRSLIDPDFPYFPTVRGEPLRFVTMIEYDPSLPARVAFPSEGRLRATLPEALSRRGLRLTKIAESEKAAHIGFFMNGKTAEVFPGEERILVPSPEGIFNYDERPEMNAAGVADAVLAKLDDADVPVIAANFANVDVVGHIEKKDAVLRAVREVDAQLGRVVDAVRSRRATLIVTADHGTVEEWLYPDGAVNTGHTRNPVPFILADFSDSAPATSGLRDSGELADVAPTVLELLGVRPPGEMTGRSLLERRLPPRLKKAKIVLLILDGWGHREESSGNLIREAGTPHFDALWSGFPRALLLASGEAVGMPPDTVGNSEAGHLHLGAGRRVPLDRVRVDRAVSDGSFLSNPALNWAMAEARSAGRSLHLMGIISHYSSHGTIRHLFALLEAAKAAGVARVEIHGFLGRRGELPESGAVYVEKVEARCRELGIGRVATVMGRYWSLDREGHWDRVEKAYRALVHGEGQAVPPEERP